MGLVNSSWSFEIIGIQHRKLCGFFYLPLCFNLAPTPLRMKSLHLSLSLSCIHLFHGPVEGCECYQGRVWCGAACLALVHHRCTQATFQARRSLLHRIGGPAADSTTALHHDGWLHIRCLNRVAAPSAEGFGKSGDPM